ncbi:hypothetical protein IEO21_10561 [Rhodonia placenta]|uniref:Uncharacterized protein n=1 Tax=Rhodonia placenta TaxID=104341 RepID=A0A8H7NS78_9APHY|nr:hypothetical protein IEO21_10561 [Postia placenta]
MLLLVGEEDNDEIMEAVVHHRLKGGGGICEAEEHHQGFIQSLISHEGSLPFVTGFDLDIIIFPSDVELCKECGTTKLIYHFSN